MRHRAWPTAGRQEAALAVCAVVLCMSSLAYGQSGVVGDVLTGSLVKPKVGAWAWYDLTDTATGKLFALRLAVVGEEKVENKTGHWFEIEVVPRLGYRATYEYKMLLTGPAKDPANVHRMIIREGAAKPQEVPVEKSGDAKDKTAKEPEKTLVGKETLTTPQGPVASEHYQLAQDGKKTDIWLNDEVRPMGIVRLKSVEGEMVLRSYGEGGKDGESTIDKVTEAAQAGAMTVDAPTDQPAKAKPEGPKEKKPKAKAKGKGQ